MVHICLKANRADLLGRNPDEMVTLATAYGVYKDFQGQLGDLFYGRYQEKSWEEALKNYTIKFEGYFKKLNGILGKKEFMCGGLTYFDFIRIKLFI